MQDILSLAGANLLTSMILCFALGLFAALARSEFSIPEAVAKGMSIHLLSAIGFTGGVVVADHGLDTRLVAALAVRGLRCTCTRRSGWKSSSRRRWGGG